MLYYIFNYLHSLGVSGSRVFQYISFRAALAIILSLLISTVLGKYFINILKRKQIDETIRDLGLEGENSKKGTPTMGGIIIIIAILIPTIFFAKLDNIYIIMMLITTLWLGLIGFIDDYIKVFRKNKEGLAAKFKLSGQVILSLIIGLILIFNSNIVIREKTGKSSKKDKIEITDEEILKIESPNSTVLFSKETKNPTKTTIPFVKNNEFDYSYLLPFISDKKFVAEIVYLIFIIIIITAVSNGANITDGLDGLATGISAIIGATLGILAYVSGNTVFANYLNIMYIPNSGELVIYISAFVGACVGFLWYNAYPAQVFMGDTGSLALGGIIAVFAIMIRKELLIPVLCGIFLIENISVLLQVSYFKYTKRKFGEGKRIFKMAPIHHHYQLKGYHEAKIVLRFFIVGILLAVITVITLKMR